jgi:DNA (cytosine-5)-methyltransferase 1
MLTTFIDLFSGAGGFSTGGVMAGMTPLWAANHWPAAVEIHARNHPRAAHVCQDLQQADWSQVPAHDVMLASPCCQGHSRARGKAAGNPQHDASRSTAWAVVAAAEFHRPPVVVVENVREFFDWVLFPAWRAAMEALGYTLAPHVVDAANHGVAQHRTRLFLVCTRSKRPLMLDLPQHAHVGSASLIDFGAGRWSQIDKPGRAAATLSRVRAGRAAHGDRFVICFYGSERGGRSLARPLGTITTRDRWAVIDRDRMRMLTAEEVRRAMGFPDDYVLPANHKAAVHMLGNAVVPMVARDILECVRRQA